MLAGAGPAGTAPRRDLAHELETPKEYDAAAARQTQSETPATEKQRAFMDKLGVERTEATSKSEAMKSIRQQLDALDNGIDHVPATTHQREILTGYGIEAPDAMTRAAAFEAIHAAEKARPPEQSEQPPVRDDRTSGAGAAAAVAEVAAVDIEECVARHVEAQFERGAERSPGGPYKHAADADLTAKGIPADAITARLDSAPGMSHPPADATQAAELIAANASAVVPSTLRTSSTPQMPNQEL